MKHYLVHISGAQTVRIKADRAIFLGKSLLFFTGGHLTAEFIGTHIAGYEEVPA